MIRRAVCLLIGIFLIAEPAVASRTLDKVPAALDPNKAYVVVEIGKLDDALLYGTLVLARYDSEKGDIAEPTPPPNGKIPRGGWVLDNRIHIIKPAVKNKEQRLYIAELDPGLWVVEGANDTAFSLGSSTMLLIAGTVTDLGVASVYSDFPDGEKREVLTAGRLFRGAVLGGLVGRLPPPMPKAVDFRTRGQADIPLPAVFAGSAQSVEWASEVRFGNHLGGLVNRMGGRKARYRALSAELSRSDEDVTAEAGDTGAPPATQSGND